MPARRLPLRGALLAWLAILALAFLNGGLRELVLVPRLGLPAALVLSGLLLCTCILAVALACIPRLGPLDRTQWLGMGLLWLLLTLGFEFGFGRMVQGRSWPELLAAYRFRDGNLWPAVLVFTLFAPLLAARLRGGGRPAR